MVSIIKLYLSKIQWTLITITYMLAILGSSLQPALHQKHDVVRETVHNGLHVPAYMGLTFLLVSTFQSYNTKSRVVLRAFFISASWGWINEIVQSYVPGRTCLVSDEVLNIIGTGLSLILMKKIKWLTEDKK